MSVKEARGLITL